jgi:N-acetylmuramoyl-L-alanine amidase
MPPWSSPKGRRLPIDIGPPSLSASTSTLTGNRGISGIQTFYRSSRGQIIARTVQRAMDRDLPGINRGIAYANYKVLRETAMPAILVEAGFISNRTEAARCGSANHRQKNRPRLLLPAS